MKTFEGRLPLGNLLFTNSAKSDFSHVKLLLGVSQGMEIELGDGILTEQLFGQLRRASPPDAVEIAKALPEPQRARLATFCYYRSHLRALGLMIASSCDRNALVDASGVAGDTIYHQSRDPNKTLSEDVGSCTSKPISLSEPNVR